MNLQVVIKKWALYNAIKYNGKARIDAVVAKVINEIPKIRKKIKEIIPLIEKIVEEINNIPLEKQIEILKEIAPELLERKKEEKKELKPLPKAEFGKVVMRMAPAITGYPHIGHTYAFLLNYLYSEKYKGKFVVRYEDTDPKLAKEEYYDAWDEFIEIFDLKYSEKKIISKDYMEILYDYGKKMIEKGYAYVCLKPKEEISKARKEGIELEDRNRSIEDNLELFEKMLNNEFKEGEAVVLLKGDMKSENTRMRDPALFRIVDHPHPLTGEKYIVWPTYDFSNAVCDALQGVTHIIRSSEFELARELHDFIRKILGFKEIVTIEVSRINIKNNLVSKRKIRKLIEEGKVMGWDDPRLVTVKGLLRRGIVKETFFEFVKEIGLTKAHPEITFDKIAAINRKILDKKAKRIFAVIDPVILEVENVEGGEAKVPWHPDVDMGYRTIEYGNEFYVPREALNLKEFRLLHLFNVKVKEIKDNKIIGIKTGEEIIKDMRKLQWVPLNSKKIEIWIIDDLLKNGEFNENSLIKKQIPIENNIDLIKEGEIVQLERIGFARKESKNILILSHK